MHRRSRAREVALQLLFQRDQNKVELPAAAVDRFCRDRLLNEPDMVAFAVGLYEGTMTHKAQTDGLISATAENWRLARMMPVDRNVLRLATYELLHAPEPSPAVVVIDEAIELARRFGTADSPAFVNGILDKIAKNHGRIEPAQQPTSEPT